MLGLFLLGPLAGIWILKGNLSSSLLLETVPLTDPLTLLQSLAAGHWPITTLWLGAAIVLAGYWLVGGGCSALGLSVNLITDAAARLRGRLGLKGNGQFSRATRYWLLAMVLVVPAVVGVMAWELINPVSLAMRGLLFGMGAGWALLAALFLFDLFVVERGWCGHLCPVGAFYAWSTGSDLSRFLPRGASGATTAWIVMRSARSVPSCAGLFMVPSAVTGP